MIRRGLLVHYSTNGKESIFEKKIWKLGNLDMKDLITYENAKIIEQEEERRT
jgi:hypothetical protein